MKVAVYYDWINQWGGAERVLIDILSIYPQADIYTLYFDKSATGWLPSHLRVFCPKINTLNFLTLPFIDIIAESFDFSQYDLVIATTTNIGHCLLTGTNTKFVVYYHNINRHLYQTHHPILSNLGKLYIHFDRIYAKRPDIRLCNSQTVQSRLKDFYQIDSTVVNPGIDTEFFVPKLNNSRTGFLIVSRLVPHKNIETAIKACIKLEKPLTIIGTGRQKNYLQSRYSHHNIKFLGTVDDKTLLSYYQQSLALICPQEEDYGLTPIESQSCQTPVIALKKGGITQTVIENITGIFYQPNSVEGLVDAIIKFESTRFNRSLIRQNALKYSRKRFMLNFKKSIEHE